MDFIVDASDDRAAELLERLRAAGATVDDTALDRLRRDGLAHVSVGPVRVDLLLTADPLSRAVARQATVESVLGLPVGVARAEELIVMKLLARRPQDIMDIQGLLVASRDRLDLEAIRRWLPELDELRPGAAELFEQLKREFHDPLPPAG